MTPIQNTPRRSRGAPPGPRVRAVNHFDEDGMYSVWPDKTCGVCAVGLTSRNRYRKSTLCIEHGREHDRNRGREGEAPTPRKTSGATVRKEQSPEHVRLYSCFNLWVRNPSNDEHCRAMRQAMDCHELNERIRRAIPALPVLPTYGA